jgi:hypothetical protein
MDCHTAVGEELKDGLGRPRAIGHGHGVVQIGTRCSNGNVCWTSRVALTAIDTITSVMCRGSGKVVIRNILFVHLSYLDACDLAS